MVAQTASPIGQPVSRVDGALKVSGAAEYPSDLSYPNLAHAVLVQSTIAAGRITRIDTAAAEAAPGVLAVITHQTAPRLGQAPASVLGGAPPPPLQDDRILYFGQHIGVVVAETREEALAAARLIEVEYERDEALLSLDDPRAELSQNPRMPDVTRGDVSAALANEADVHVEVTYTTPRENHNPLGPFATLAVWDGQTLTVHDATQFPDWGRSTLASAFDVPEEHVRVQAPFVGGAFGAGLRTWPHVVLAAVAARQVGRPVKLVLSRPQMFTSVGYRPATVQHLKLGATRDGRLVAMDHEGIEPLSREDNYGEALVVPTTMLYACPNLSARYRQVRLNLPCPTWMRGPGEAQGVYALECALDELAYALGIDPLELRLRNYAEVHPQSGRPWTSNSLRACYEQGAARFGWAQRSPEPRSMHSGRWLVGYGLATGYYPYFQFPAQARATLRHDGTVVVCSAATDIGPGTYTVMTQVVAGLLGLPLEQVRFDLGDTAMPPAPPQGGSNLTAAVGTAVHAACTELLKTVLATVADDPASPLRGATVEDIVAADGKLGLKGDPNRAESYVEIMARHNLTELLAEGQSEGAPAHAGESGAFAARFVEVHVDPDLGLIRVARIVSAVDGGRILNPKTAESQIIGGTIGGIGMALFEETAADPGTGRIANATFGDYLVPVHADVPDLDVIFVGEPTPMNPLGVKGIGEVAIVGVAPAIANAVFHATGRRIRSLPITIDQLL